MALACFGMLSLTKLEATDGTIAVGLIGTNADVHCVGHDRSHANLSASVVGCMVLLKFTVAEGDATLKQKMLPSPPQSQT